MERSRRGSAGPQASGHQAISKQAHPGANTRLALGIDTLDCFWKAELAGLAPARAQRFLKLPPVAGATTTLVSSDGDPRKKVTVEGFETIKVPAGTFDKCARIRINTTWRSGTKYTARIWLAPGIGLVKWIKNTGRVEELAAYRLKE